MELNRFNDHTLLTPNAMDVAYEELVLTAIKHNFYAVCVAPHFAATAVGMLEGDADVKVCSVVAFPHGNIPVGWKLNQAEALIRTGVHEIDWVINCGDVFAEDWGRLDIEMARMANLCAGGGVVSKVIVESSVITHPRLLTNLFSLVRDTGVDFIKTSTGFNGPGANLAHVQLWNNLRGDAKTPRIKASGGIKTPQEAIAFIEAGADRLGMSASVDIYEKWLALQGDTNGR
jgi:deoxyribose-phosphate aldolase